MRDERHMLEQLLAEDPLAQHLAAFDETAADGGDHDVALFHAGQPEHAQRRRDRQQFLVGEVGGLHQPRQVGSAEEALLGEHFEHAFHAADVGIGQALGQIRMRAPLDQGLRRTDGHLRVDLVDQLAHPRAVGIARLRQRDGQLRAHPPRIAGEDQDPVGHHHRLLDVVRHDEDRLDRHAAAAPELEDLVAQAFAGQHVERGEGLVHQQHLGLHDQRARDADALAHAAGELARQRALEACEADHVDRLRGAAFALGLRDATRLQPQLDVLPHRQPREQGEGLEHHADAARGAVERLAAVPHFTRIGLQQAGHQAQQGRLAGAGLPQQGDDFSFVQREVDVLQHRARSAVRRAEGFPHGRELEDGRGLEVGRHGQARSQ